jgi:hypothetical protein
MAAYRPPSLASRRSYYFRLILRRDYWPHHVERFRLDDFRDLWRKAGAMAREMERASKTPYRP